eukprot:5311634-Pyramimonas_sp.AAC.1
MPGRVPASSCKPRAGRAMICAAGPWVQLRLWTPWLLSTLTRPQGSAALGCRPSASRAGPPPYT